jgi:hypothetical protein
VATAAQRKLKARRKAKLAPTAARRVRRHVVRPAAPVGRKKTPPKPPPKPSKPPRKR